ELRGNTVADEKAGAFGLTAGAGQLALRLAGSRLEADEYRIPGSPSRQGGALNEADSAALGLSWIGSGAIWGWPTVSRIASTVCWPMSMRTATPTARCGIAAGMVTGTGITIMTMRTTTMPVSTCVSGAGI